MPLIGTFSLVLHTHLPYVISHGKWPHGMDWLSEATAETYLPLLRVLDQLVREGFPPKVTIDISPVLCEQLSDPTFKEEFNSYLRLKVESARVDLASFQKTPPEGSKVKQEIMIRLAQDWEQFYEGLLRDFNDTYHQDVIGAFRRLQDDNQLEIFTCAATHGYLPLLYEDACIEAQLHLAVQNYQKHFGRRPRGIWLPECAYRPQRTWSSPLGDDTARLRRGLEEFLDRHQLRYFFVDSHLIAGGKALGVYLERFESLKKYWSEFSKGYTDVPSEFKRSSYQSYLVRSRDHFLGQVYALVRDPKTGLQVWSGEHGYPGDGQYLDFHKKHWPGGHRYWRVTSTKADLGDKQLYEPDKVPKRVEENAGHYKEMIRQILLNEGQDAESLPIVCAPYDTELFGHWWFEGPQWIYHVLKWVNQDPELRMLTASEYLEQVTTHRIVSLPEGSWGEGGYHHIWFNPDTAWTWELIYPAEQTMVKAARQWGSHSDPRVQEVLKQLAVELLLLESSDWQFLISTIAARDYAETRALGHAYDFKQLYALLETLTSGQEPDATAWHHYQTIHQRDALFPEVDPLWWTGDNLFTDQT